MSNYVLWISGGTPTGAEGFFRTMERGTIGTAPTLGGATPFTLQQAMSMRQWLEPTYANKVTILLPIE